MRNPAPSSCSSAAVAAAGGGGTTTPTPCCSKVGLKRGPWTTEEDELLSNYINKDGEGKWRTLPKRAGLLRCGKSCRLRWMNYLRPSVKHGRISPDKEDLILRLHRLLDNRWSLIAGRIPGRTDNEIKNYWNTHLSKKLISQGIDPRTHKPLDDAQVQLSNNGKHKINHKSPNSSSSSKAPSAPPNPNPIPTQSDESNYSTPPITQSDQPPILHINTTTAGFSFNCQVNQNPNGIGAYHHLNFPTSFNSNNSASGRISPGSQEDHQEDDPGYCTDEVFSSFLNSIIDGEIFTCQAQQEQLPNLDALLAQPTSSSALAFGTAGWDAPPLTSTTSSATALHHNLPDVQPQ